MKAPPPIASVSGSLEVAPRDETIDRLLDTFGNNAAISGTVEEAIEGVWPF